MTLMVPPDIVSSRDEALLALALSDERDLWLRLLDAYSRGFADGRAAACVALAEIEDRYASAAQWNEWARRLRAADVRAIRARHPRTWSHLERCAVLGVRLADLQPGEFTWRQHG